VWLRLPKAERLQFLAGQYIDEGMMANPNLAVWPTRRRTIHARSSDR